MMTVTEQGKEAALRALEERRANKPEQIRNEDLHAGSPMYFYCRSCAHLADTKPESYIHPPKKLCDECQAMKDCGWLE
jgi:hypothetical protein